MTSCWLITYVWRYNSKDSVNYQYDLHEGSLVDWVLEAEQQPESWKLINAVKISFGEYTKLKGEIG